VDGHIKSRRLVDGVVNLSPTNPEPLITLLTSRDPHTQPSINQTFLSNKDQKLQLTMRPTLLILTFNALALAADTRVTRFATLIPIQSQLIGHE
jgi:hypothetical protein